MMTVSRMTTKDVERVTSRMVNEMAGAADQTLQQFAVLQEERAARHSRVHRRLAAELGPDHPRVVTLGEMAAAAHRVRESLRDAATRQSRQPKVGPHEWMVFGRVRSAEGQPAAGLCVRVFDRERRYDDLLGDTYTDEFGDFAVVYHDRDFATVGDGLPELYVLVEDVQGNELYSSGDALRIQPGRVEYFDIVLPTERTSAGPRDSTRTDADG